MAPFVVLGLVALAWAAFVAGRIRTDHLNLSKWGSDPSIAESLAIDSYRAGTFRPYVITAVLLDTLALGIGMQSILMRPRQSRALWVAIGVLWMASAGFHCFGLVVTQFFASI
jgi:hypothetical protein